MRCSDYFNGNFHWLTAHKYIHAVFVQISFLYLWEINLIWFDSIPVLLHLKMAHDPSDYQSTFRVPVSTWCLQTTSHNLSQSWPRSISPYGVDFTPSINVNQRTNHSNVTWAPWPLKSPATRLYVQDHQHSKHINSPHCWPLLRRIK